VPEHNAIEVLDGVVERARETLYGGLPDNTGEAVKAARPAFDKVFAEWADAKSAVAELRTKLPAILDDRSLTEDAKRTRSDELVAAAQIKTSAALTQIEATSKELTAKLAPMARPQRPEGDIDGRVANVRQELSMLLDRLPSDQAQMERMARFLEDSLIAGDDVAAWVVASTSWPKSFIESRSGDAGILHAFIEPVLDRRLSGNAAIARRVLRTLEDQYGLNAVSQGASHYVKHGVDDAIFSAKNRKVNA
jgi:hypothetical protein